MIQFAMKEEGGVTTLELALKASSLIRSGATELPGDLRDRRRRQLHRTASLAGLPDRDLEIGIPFW